jgi:hypothetical protein
MGFLGLAPFAPHIDLTCRVFADKHRGEAGWRPEAPGEDGGSSSDRLAQTFMWSIPRSRFAIRP